MIIIIIYFDDNIQNNNNKNIQKRVIHESNWHSRVAVLLRPYT